VPQHVATLASSHMRSSNSEMPLYSFFVGLPRRLLSTGDWRTTLCLPNSLAPAVLSKPALAAGHRGLAWETLL
jgi:hypothetical protein